MFDGTGMTPELFAAVFRVFAQKRAHLHDADCKLSDHRIIGCTLQINNAICPLRP